VSLMFGILSVYGIDMNSPKYENFEWTCVLEAGLIPLPVPCVSPGQVLWEGKAVREEDSRVWPCGSHCSEMSDQILRGEKCQVTTWFTSPRTNSVPHSQWSWGKRLTQRRCLSLLQQGNLRDRLSSEFQGITRQYLRYSWTASWPCVQGWPHYLWERAKQ
jgi:hypothetical protein